MNTQEILSIIALSLLGLCFLCGLAKTAMKKDSDKKNCDKACSLAIFAAVALVGVSQLLTETEKYDSCPIASASGSENCPEGQMPICQSGTSKGQNCLGQVGSTRPCPDVCCCSGV